MTDTQTIETINAHLDEHPTDWVARLELADLLELGIRGGRLSGRGLRKCGTGCEYIVARFAGIGG